MPETFLARGPAVVFAGFFDREEVNRLVDRQERKALSRFGAFVRTRARSSIRKRKAISPPGSPPSDHGGALKRLLFFAYDKESRSVVIGPTLFTGTRRSGQVPRAPESLEKGAFVTAPGVKPRHYRPRPFMLPAFEKEKAIWERSFKE